MDQLRKTNSDPQRGDHITCLQSEKGSDRSLPNDDVPSTTTALPLCTATAICCRRWVAGKSLPCLLCNDSHQWVFAGEVKAESHGKICFLLSILHHNWDVIILHCHMVMWIHCPILRYRVITSLCTANCNQDKELWSYYNNAHIKGIG